MRGICQDAWDMSFHLVAVATFSVFHLVVVATFSVFHWGMCKAKTSNFKLRGTTLIYSYSFLSPSHNTVLAARDTRILRSASTLLRRSSMLRQGGTLAQHHLLVAAFHCG